MATATVKDFPRPEPGRMYGLTHSTSGLPIVRRPKLLKVGIGLPKGPAIYTYLREAEDGTGPKWRVVIGYGNDAKFWEWPQAERGKAEAFYQTNRPGAPNCPYPRKIPFFLFSHQTGDGTFEADFDAIEAHGPMPTELDVIFLDEDPFFFEYAMWSASRKECYGDGINAMRVHDRAITTDPQSVLDIFAKEKYFPVIGRCWISGDCPYSRSTWKKGAQGQDIEVGSLCKRSGDFKFQLVNCLRIGGTAYFHTTGAKSIEQLNASLIDFRSLTGGRLSRIPFVAKLRPFPTNHNGQAGTAYAVSLEFRADTVDKLRESMLAGIAKFTSLRASIAAAPALLPAADDGGLVVGALVEDDDDDDGEVTEEMKARAISDEFSEGSQGEQQQGQRDPEPTPGGAAKPGAKPGPVPGPVPTGPRAAPPQPQETSAKPAGATGPSNGGAPAPGPSTVKRLSKDEFSAEQLQGVQFKLRASRVAMNRAQLESWLAQNFTAGEVDKAIAEATRLAEEPPQ